jgi:glutamate carboxypeptidase
MNELLELVKKWAEINSHSHNPEGLQQMRQALRAAFSPLASETHEQENGLLHFKKTTPNKRRLVLIGHYDTVYPTNFAIEVKDKYLYGPGVADMKGGLVILFHALKHLQDFSWDVLLNPDEEIGSKGSMPYMIQVTKGADFGFIFEPALPNGSLVNTRPATGLFTLTAKGVEAHAGRNPEAGKSAILALCELIYHLSFLHRPEEECLLNVGTIQGGTAVNVVPGQAIARLNLRTKTDEQFSSSVEVMRDVVLEISKRHHLPIDLEITSLRPQKMMTTKTKLLMKQFQQVYQVEFEPSRGACDSNDLSHTGVPFIDSLGPIGFDLHSSNERLLISSLDERLKLFLKALKTI